MIAKPRVETGLIVTFALIEMIHLGRFFIEKFNS